MNTPSGNPDWVQACKHDDGMFSAIVIPIPTKLARFS